jgi:hypothetical protein
MERLIRVELPARRLRDARTLTKSKYHPQAYCSYGARRSRRTAMLAPVTSAVWCWIACDELAIAKRAGRDKRDTVYDANARKPSTAQSVPNGVASRSCADVLLPWQTDRSVGSRSSRVGTLLRLWFDGPQKGPDGAWSRLLRQRSRDIAEQRWPLRGALVLATAPLVRRTRRQCIRRLRRCESSALDEVLAGAGRLQRQVSVHDRCPIPRGWINVLPLVGIRTVESCWAVVVGRCARPDACRGSLRSASRTWQPAPGSGELL